MDSKTFLKHKTLELAHDAAVQARYEMFTVMHLCRQAGDKESEELERLYRMLCSIVRELEWLTHGIKLSDEMRERGEQCPNG